MVQLTRSFFVISLFAASFATPAKRTVAQIEADIGNIGALVTALDNQVNGFPASGLAGALGIHTAAVSLGSAIDQGTTDIEATSGAGPISESDGTTILDMAEALEPTILDALSAIITKKAAFAALPISGLSALVLQDLKNLNTSTTTFEAVIVALMPTPELKQEAMDLGQTIGLAFETAIEAYE